MDNTAQDSQLVTPKRKLNRQEIFSLLAIVILVVAIFSGVYLSGHPTIFFNKAAPAANIFITSPTPNQQVNGLIVIKATSRTSVDASKLTAIVKVDNSGSESMRVTKASDGLVSIGTALTASKYGAGPHAISVYLYDDTDKSPQLIGNSQVNIQISQ
jgi:hypothetical protein